MRVMLTVTMGLLLVCEGTAFAQAWQPPSESQRCPSKWGPNDERGSANHMKQETVLRAARLMFPHQMINGSMYNCVKIEDAATRTGFSKVGVQQVGALLTRGVLPRRAGGTPRPRVRPDRRAAQDPERHGIDGRADRRPVTR